LRSRPCVRVPSQIVEMPEPGRALLVAQSGSFRRPLAACGRLKRLACCRGVRLIEMKPAPGEWDSLRLAAKAADRAKAAAALRPAFEERLRGLGYSSLAIAHAFSTLTGPGTIEGALAELEENARLERMVPVPLDFEDVEREPALPVGHALTITGVEHDARGIRITYEIRPALWALPGPPRVEARDERDQQYRGLGMSIGLSGSQDRMTTLGSITVPLPQPHASLLRVRMSWSKDSTSLWRGPAHELRITL
jgi:hypothetical protein